MYIAPCVPGVVDRESFEYLRSLGANIFGENSKSWRQLEDAWKELLKNGPEYIFDIGGGVIKLATESGVKIKSASEATSTGINMIKKFDLSFPVFNWNDLNIKKLMHNRYEVGSGIWYAFRNLTGLDICRLNIGVLGFGLVGQSVASIAKGLGARVWIYDKDHVKMLSAASEGYNTAGLEHVLRNVQVLITATGLHDAITKNNLIDFRKGLIIANAGHDSREINLEGLGFKETVIPNIDLYRHESKEFYLLCGGGLLNLMSGGGSAVNTFDLVTATITDVIEFLVTEGANYNPGLHMLPEAIEKDLVEQTFYILKL